MKVLIATTCVAVLGASGVYFHDQYRDYRIARHDADCKKLFSAARTFAVVADEPGADPVWQRYLDRNAKEIVATGCEQ